MPHRLALFAAVLVAACSPTADNAAVPVPDPTTAAVRPRALTPVDPPAVAAVSPRPGDLKTFRDWTVGCDNGGTCKMVSLRPEGGDFPVVTMNVAREGGPRGQWLVELAGDAATPAGVVVDGRRVALGKGRFAGPEAEAIAAALVAGRRLSAIGADGEPLGSVSLAGAAAALRYIDDRQGRAGTVTAIVAKGDRASDGVPEPAALPVVEVPRADGTPATPSAQQLAAMRRTAACDVEGFAGSQPAERHALGGGATLVLVPCSAGAYNLSAALFVLKDGKVAPALADVPTGFAIDSDPRAPAQIVNAEVRDGLVASYSKGRGLGDCGVRQDFVWDGARLRLVKQAMMGECRGNPDYITTWIARVVRR